MKNPTKEQRRQIAVIAAKTDANIDLSDMPEVVDWSGAEVGKFYRPAEADGKNGISRKSE